MDSRADRFRRVVLETSLKPFPSFSDDDIAVTGARIAAAWAPLLARGDSAAVLLWIADGSELLEWAGDETAPVEWGRWVGFNNTEADPYGHNVTREKWAVPYRADAPALDYAGIRRIVAGLRAAIEEAAGIPVEIGATMDSGPEFAASAFKYERHSEILADGAESGVGRVIRMVRPWNSLHADPSGYAAYPQGIPEATAFGEFLGRQSREYLGAMGFDYLWLSNGFGFSAYSWTALGEVFDGARFASNRAAEVRGRILDFWTVFEAEVGHPVEVRGTNFGIGMDVGTDAVPTRDIYRSPVVRMPPPNSPWGPLNRDFGIELTGYLSRIARLPGEGFPFRFYLADPWFWQTPWRDFYGGEPFDIHLPLSLSRLGADGVVEVPSDIEILTIDTQRGELDADAAAEVAVFVARSRKALPDAAAPLVWLYPFDAYHDVLEQNPERIDQGFFEDWFASAAVSASLPLGTVIDVAEASGALNAGALEDSVLVVPASGLDGNALAVVEAALRRGLDVVSYGSFESRPAAAVLAGLAVDADPLEGDLALAGELGTGTLRHVAVLSGGGLVERVVADDVVVLATAGGRPYATERRVGAGRLSWLRGSSDFDSAPEDENGLRTPRRIDRQHLVSPATLLGAVVGRSGWEAARVGGDAEAGDPVVVFARSAGSLRVAAYLPDTTIALGLRTPAGAPVVTGRDACVVGDRAVYHPGVSLLGEARVFVTQAEESTVTVAELAPFPYGAERLIAVRGLRRADVVLTLPPGRAEHSWITVDGVGVDPTPTAVGLLVRGVEGELVVGWWRETP